MGTIKYMTIMGIVLTVLWYIGNHFGGYALVGVFAIIAFVLIIYILARSPDTNSGDDGL